jgi:predicted ATPase
VPLVEREVLLAQISACVAAAGAGRGSLILVSGEAGAGKTALIRQALPAAIWGYCESLATPRPLGPFRDISAQLWPGPPVQIDSLAMADRLFRRLAEPGAATAPLVIEDAHWIDTASADVVRFLGRRIANTAGVVVMTMREELRHDGPLQPVLGDLTSFDGIMRIQVPPLSVDGVRELVAGTGLDVDDVLRLTNGNAFLVSQLVGAPRLSPSAPVRDSVMARLGRLAEPTRQVVELLSVIPGRVSAELIGPDWAHLDDAVDSGLLRVDGAMVEFRHELVRLAVEGELPPARRRELHADVLARMTAQGGATEPAQLAHHARQSHNVALALASEQSAARRAAALGSHREAAAHYHRAVEDAKRIASPAEQARLLIQLAAEESAIAHDVAAFAAATQAMQLCADLDDAALCSIAAGTLSKVTPSEDEALRLARAAVQLSEPLTGSVEQAAAYAILANNRMIARDLPDAVATARHAIELAQAAGDAATEVVASNALGSALLLDGTRPASCRCGAQSIWPRPTGWRLSLVAPMQI